MSLSPVTSLESSERSRMSVDPEVQLFDLYQHLMGVFRTSKVLCHLDR